MKWVHPALEPPLLKAIEASRVRLANEAYPEVQDRLALLAIANSVMVWRLKPTFRPTKRVLKWQ